MCDLQDGSVLDILVFYRQPTPSNTFKNGVDQTRIRLDQMLFCWSSAYVENVPDIAFYIVVVPLCGGVGYIDGMKQCIGPPQEHSSNYSRPLMSVIKSIVNVRGRFDVFYVF